MGAWAYCTYCEAGFDKPNAREVVKGERDCHSCGETNSLHYRNSEERLIELAELVDKANDRIGELEANVRFLLDQVKS